MSSEADQQPLRVQLVNEQISLEAAIVSADNAAQTVELDQTRQGRLSRMDALQGQAMAQAAGRRNRIRLRQIAAAIQRIDNDEYGECEDCGNEIPLARLQFDPCTTLCVHCAEERER